MRSKSLDYLTLTLVVIGALNWGILGIFGLNPIGELFGGLNAVTRLIYALVGISGFYCLSLYAKLDYIDDVKKIDEDHDVLIVES